MNIADCSKAAHATGFKACLASSEVIEEDPIVLAAMKVNGNVKALERAVDDKSSTRQSNARHIHRRSGKDVAPIVNILYVLCDDRPPAFQRRLPIPCVLFAGND
jgi:hypothetical protein